MISKRISLCLPEPTRLGHRKGQLLLQLLVRLVLWQQQQVEASTGLWQTAVF